MAIKSEGDGNDARKASAVGRQLDVLWTSGTLTGISDAQLLGRFAEARDATAEAAFRELVNRHGADGDGGLPPDPAAAARRGRRVPGDVSRAGAEGPFDPGARVARPLALQRGLSYGPAGSVASPRATASETGAEMEAIEAAPADSPHFDLRSLLQEELSRLPDKYRAPIVLCHLEGKTHEEAARLLRWPVGTVSGRLSRGRELFKTRLERRGLAIAPAIIAASWPDLKLSVPSSLAESILTTTTQFATSQSVSASVLSLTRGVLKTMLLKKVTRISLAVFLIGAVSGGVWAHRPSAGSKNAPQGDGWPRGRQGNERPHLLQAARPTAEPLARSRNDSDSPVAGDRPDDCPLLCMDDRPPWCPLGMAANALSRLINRFHSSP